MFLKIVNPKECPIEGFTVLGVSTSRHDEDKIGEFGSGNKHAVNVCLRHGINPTIYCGTRRIEFFTQPETMGEKQFNRVYYKISNRKPVASSVAAEYGEKDWGDMHMAMREFVSNALDAADGNTNDIEISIVDKIRGVKDKTVIGLPLTPDIQNWFNNKAHYFLHFQGNAPDKLAKTILPKDSPDPCKVYRKGVLVRSSDAKSSPSLFDYNLGDGLKIDECRNMSESSVREKVCDVIAQDKDSLVMIFNSLEANDKIWENDLDSFSLKWAAQRNRQVWKDAWKATHGNGLASLSNTVLGNMAIENGHRLVRIENVGWYEAIRAAGISTCVDVLDNVSKAGDVTYDAEMSDDETLERVWTWLELATMTKGKDKPALKIFKRCMDGGNQTYGYYEDGTIFIHEEARDNLKVWLEELAHHVTGSTDYSRDLQDFSFRFSTVMATAAGF